MTTKKAASKKVEEPVADNRPLWFIVNYCPQCLDPLPQQHPSRPEDAELAQSVTCGCGWSGEVHPFVRAGS